MKATVVTLHAVIDETFQIPNFVIGSTMRAESNATFPAGKGVSVSIGLSGLGLAENTRPVVLCGSADVGAYHEVFRDIGIPLEQTVVIGGDFKTRRHVTILDPLKRSKSVTHLQVQGIQHSPDLFVEVIALCGSLPQGAPMGLYESLTRKATSLGKKVILDTSGEALRSGINALPYAIKPNREELEWLVRRALPDPTRVADAAQELRRAHPGLELVVASDGPNGIIVANSQGSWHGIIPDLGMTETIQTEQGCGDALVAGIISTLLLGSDPDPEYLTKKLVSVASANLLINGPGALRASDVERFQKQVIVKSI